MIAETQISMEIVENHEKSSCYQDIPKPNCNGISDGDQTNHSDTPYVNGSTDDSVHNMKELVVEEGFIAESDYALEIKNNAAEVSEFPKMEEENMNMNPVVVISNVTEQDGSSDGGGVQVSVDDTPEQQNEETENRAEAEINEIGVPCERFETVNVQEENLENVAEVEIEQVEYPTGIDRTEIGNDKNHIRNFELLSEIKWGKFDSPIKSEPFPSQVAPVPEEEAINAHISESHNEKDEFEVQNNLEPEATDVCHESQYVTADAVESESQDLRTEGRKEFNLVREALELAEHEVPLAASFDSVLHSNPTDGEVTLQEEAKIALGSELIENPKYDSASVDKVQGVIEQVDEAKTMVDCNNKHLGFTRDVVLEEKNIEDGFVSHVEDSAESVEERDNGVCPEIMQSQTKTKASLPTQSLPAHDSETETVLFGAKSVKTESSSPIDSPKSQIFENGLEINMKSTTDSASSGSYYVFGTVCIETDVPVEKTEVVSSPYETADVKLKSEVPGSSAASIEEISSDVTVKSRKDISDNSDVSNKGVSDMSETADVKHIGYQLDSVTEGTDENLFVQENRDTGKSQSDRITVDSPKGSSTALISGEETNITAVSKPFNYIIRIPRFNDESLKEQIRVEELNIDEKTKLRDAIQIQINEKRANNQIFYGADYEYIKGEYTSAQQLVRSKRTEIDSLLQMINKAKIGTSIEDIDKQIYNKEHMMQHETLNLKQEKQFIRDIQQLKQQRRELLSSNMFDQGEIEQAVEQREEVEEKLKSRRKDLEILKRKELTAKAAFLEANRKIDEENMKVKELEAQRRVANELRQEAYVQLQSLKKERWQKNQHFYRYKDDVATANNFASRRDRGALYSHCLNQMENFMELWNTNEEFRKEYVSENTRSTISRLGTLDGRSLGPDEKRHILPSYVNERVNKMVSTPTKVNTISQSHPESKLETTVENGTLDGKSINIVSEQDNHKEAEEAAKPVLGNGLATISDQSAPDQVEETPVKSKEEIELAKKEEEEAEAKLKEQRRMEELAKAKEARERKKRQAEKLQRKAEVKAQKEAEEKEKKREKRLRKKERKKKVATDGSDSNKKSEYSGPTSESTIETITSKEIEAKETSCVSNATTKKAQKSKQSTTKLIPPPVRNRNKKKKMQQYAYALVGLVLVIFLFWMGWVGNLGLYFSKVNSK